ncbi:hypothetical protein CQW49_14300 [Methylosinus trichosporium OB3b]|uniref:Uncharacterized protein n=1 Tax=Methylosinus trichosporium (strain ATCC 35070 / NCIMB 11131 / UNIQEM 75 / OB3b) TaxID=595536 RepID=A0A2D2D1S5_METT3|nr:hypothetical protein [Methylosinus sp. 3S-1]ATQ68924.1 hypothetical protein CQW49_14300 [Methylosinus trichosporium OB3b]OBS52284.1 hypothetical protein A8B73_11885 [Methylosinus sp. 3S-1]
MSTKIEQTRERRLEMLHMQVIEGNPLTHEEIVGLSHLRAIAVCFEMSTAGPARRHGPRASRLAKISNKSA